MSKLTDAQFRMLRFLAMPSLRSGHDEKNPGKIAMLRHLEERGLTTRGSISLRRPRWKILEKGRALLCQDCFGWGTYDCEDERRSGVCPRCDGTGRAALNSPVDSEGEG